MSNIEATRVMGAVTADRTQVLQAGNAPGQTGGDPMRTQMGGTMVCPICRSATPLMEPFCGDCGFLLTSAPPEETTLPPQEAAPAELVDLTDGRRFRLNLGVNTVGRQGTDVLIIDSTISRSHARITLENGSVVVEDLGSSNGTKVGDLRIGANQPTVAPAGTILKFGNWQARLEIGTVAAGDADKTVFLGGDKTLVSIPATDERTLPGGPPVGAGTEVSFPPMTEGEDAGPSVARLRNQQGPSPDIHITPDLVTIGRRAGNTVILPNDAFISGRHATIVTDETGTYLTDVGSTNGTFVNGERLTVDERQLLLEGDEIQLGQTRYRFEPAAPAPAESVADPDLYAEGAGLETSVAAENHSE